jgi:4-hydroxy-4-methyl-2-oxoglutarate aldolase
VSAVADVLALWGRDGWLTPPLAPVVPAGEPRLGRAVTVRIAVGDAGAGMGPLFDLLSGSLDGRVVVLAGGEAVDGAVWGEILSLATHRQGAVAALVHGSVRDVPDMTRIGLPIYAVGERVVGPNGRAHVVAVDEPVDVAGVTVAAGDTVVVDATGCVRVAAPDVEAVLAAARRYADAEHKVVTAIEGGGALAAAYLHKRSIVAELRR